jgi:small multidrug resistance pump
MKWVYLFLAIGSEILGTLSLRASDGFSKQIWLIPLALGYSLSLYLLSQSLKLGMPVGVGYAIWSGIGVILIALFAKIIWNDPLTLFMLIGFVLIIAGVVIVEIGTKRI